MFTGIIETTGILKEINADSLIIEAPSLISKIIKGSSIAVDGACLTATEITDTTFKVDVMPETFNKTNLEGKSIGGKVNLELAMPANGRFEGHIVSGHVEATGELIEIKQDQNSYLLTFQIPSRIEKYMIEKGSITINGISLTIINIGDNKFSVGIIPHTWKITNLHTLNIGDKINLETDLLAKHLEKLTKA